MDPSPSKMAAPASEFPHPRTPPETLMSADSLSISLYRRIFAGDRTALAICPAWHRKARPTAGGVIGLHSVGRVAETFGEGERGISCKAGNVPEGANPASWESKLSLTAGSGLRSDRQGSGRSPARSGLPMSLSGASLLPFRNQALPGRFAGLPAMWARSGPPPSAVAFPPASGGRAFSTASRLAT